jgi:GAF domain-containing protein
VEEKTVEPTPFNSVVRKPASKLTIDFQNFLSALSDILIQDVAECFYQQVLDLAISISPNAQAGSVLQLGEDNKYHFIAVNGYDLAALQAVTFGLDESILYASADQHSFLLHDFDAFNKDNLGVERYAILETAGKVRDIKETLCVPVRKQEMIIATLCLDNFESVTAFSTDEVVLAETLGGFSGLLLNN